MLYKGFLSGLVYLEATMNTAFSKLETDFCKAYKDTNCVYIAQVRIGNCDYAKIGQTIHPQCRYKSLKTDYTNEMRITHLFPVRECYEAEQQILHTEIVRNSISDVFHGKTEVVLLNSDLTIDVLESIAKTVINQVDKQNGSRSSLLDDKPTCMFCNDQFSTVSSLNRHQDKYCNASVDKKRIQQTIQDLHEKLKEAQRQVLRNDVINEYKLKLDNTMRS